MSKWAKVARIARTRNREGSLVVQSTDGLPFLLSEGMQVWFVPPTLKGPRTGRIERVQQLKEHMYAVSVDTVRTEEQAEKLAGSYCLVLKGELPHGIEDGAPVGLIGWSVNDETMGDLGTVDDVIVNPAQSLLSVEGPFGRVLIPVVEAFICSIDEDAEQLRVRIPQGLIGLESQEG